MKNRELKIDKRIIKRIESKIIFYFENNFGDYSNYENKKEVADYLIEECLFKDDFEDTNLKYDLDVFIIKNDKKIKSEKRLKALIKLYVDYFMEVDWKFASEYGECDYLAHLNQVLKSAENEVEILKKVRDSYE